VHSINPQLVITPDGRVGVLTARHELQGCVEFGAQRIVEAYPLVILGFHIFVFAPEKSVKGRPAKMRKV